MRRDELHELHYITLIDNVPSILTKGIMSHYLAEKVQHRSIAMQEVQNKRSTKKVPGGRMLHECANTYICARNPMLYLRRNSHAELCVLRIDPAVLDLDGVIVTDRNAASHARFSPGSTGLSLIDREQVFAEYWIHPGNVLATDDHKKIKCAEVLVPSRISPNYIVGAYVSSVQSMRRLGEIAPQLLVTMDAHLFFQEQPPWFTH
jgi:ssDNA thymidine ADP-ribosyltransferase DarT-like protein